MKRRFFFFIFLILISFGSLHAQKVLRQSINAFGNTYVASDIVVSQTAGQSSLTGTKLLEDGKTIRQGFQQPLVITRTISFSDLEVQLNVYPNPFQDVLYLEIIGDDTLVDLRLANMLGQIVFEEEINTNSKYTYNLSGLAPGVYFINLFNSSDLTIIATKRITKTL